MSAPSPEPPLSWLPVRKLSSGALVPALAFGVGSDWFRGAKGSEPLRRAIVAALDAGWRHLDDAEMYANELDVGAAIQEWRAKTGAPRTELCITSKVLSSIEDGTGIEAACRRTLTNLGLEYLDVYLLHAPFRRADASPLPQSLAELWRQMEALVAAGLVRSIGVSNFRVCDLKVITESSPTILPALNQVEMHPRLLQPRLFAACAALGITMGAFGPLVPLTKGGCCEAGATDGLSVALAAAAEAHGVSPAQVLLAWSLGAGAVTVTTTSNPARLAEALTTARSVHLSPGEFSAISAAGGSAAPLRTYWNKLQVDWDKE
jgi:diketogulonate reductase-like aldo/keto reductase